MICCLLSHAPSPSPFPAPLGARTSYYNKTPLLRAGKVNFSHSCLQMNTSARAVLPGLLLPPASASCARAQGGSLRRSALPAATSSTTATPELYGMCWGQPGCLSVLGLVTGGRSQLEYSLRSTLTLFLHYTTESAYLCSTTHVPHAFPLLSEN